MANKPHCDRCDRVLGAQASMPVRQELSRTFMEDKGLEVGDLSRVWVDLVVQIEDFDQMTRPAELCEECRDAALEAFAHYRATLNKARSRQGV